MPFKPSSSPRNPHCSLLCTHPGVTIGLGHPSALAPHGRHHQHCWRHHRLWPRESLAAATTEYEHSVLELVNRLSQHNLKLNPDKIKFKTHTVPFMGHVLTPEGLRPSDEIASAIVNMSQPQDKAATRRFLGMITYLAKFCPHLSEVVRPLRDLTHIRQEFLWADQYTEAFQKAKQLVSEAPCLRYFDVHAPVVLQVDASEYGLGAALLQPAATTDPTAAQWQPQSVAKLVTHSAKFWNFLDERRTTAKKNNVSQISPRPPNQCWSLFPALWSFRVWSTLCRGEGGSFT